MEATVRHGLTTHNLVHAMHVGNALSYTSATPLVPMLHRIAKDAAVESHVRGLVALAMPTLYPDAADGLLVELLRADQGREAPFTEAVLMSLGATRDAAGTAVLEQTVRDLDRPAAHRATALTSLARRGLDVRAIATSMLDDRRVEVRRAAAQALGVLPWAAPGADVASSAPRDAEAAEALEKMLERLQDERAAALEAPLRETCVRLGRVLLRERDRSVRAAAAVSLGRIARAAEAGVAVRLLLAEVRRDGDLREHAMLALAIAHAPEAVPVFLRALVDPRAAATTRAAAAIALGLAGATQGTDPLRRALTDDANPQVRGYAAVALGMLHDAPSAPRIRHLFDTTANVEARGQFGIALGLLGRRDDATALADRLAQGGSAATLWNLVEALPRRPPPPRGRAPGAGRGPRHRRGARGRARTRRDPRAERRRQTRPSEVVRPPPRRGIPARLRDRPVAAGPSDRSEDGGPLPGPRGPFAADQGPAVVREARSPVREARPPAAPASDPGRGARPEPLRAATSAAGPRTLPRRAARRRPRRDDPPRDARPRAAPARHPRPPRRPRPHGPHASSSWWTTAAATTRPRSSPRPRDGCR